jgi:eukaryotic-like serine/threonine-protein kinase
MAPEEASYGSQPYVVAGRYVLGQVIGIGSSAVVYRARDLHRDLEVAVKYFRAGATAHDLRQQRREMRALAHLRHPGLVGLHDGGIDDGRAFLVTDLVEGPTLAERIAGGPPLAPGAVRRLGAQLATALAHVHAAGFVHRDVKPANVLIDTGPAGEASGWPRLADFGIARAFDATTVTARGCVVGTAAYLAPEQVRGELVDPAADVYALGLVLLEALTGRREYPGSAIESAIARLHRRPVVPDGVPSGLDTVLTAMTQDDPRRRPSAAAVAAALGADQGSPAAARARLSRQVAARAMSCSAQRGWHLLCRPAGCCFGFLLSAARLPLLALKAVAAGIPAAADLAVPRAAAYPR